ncbi:hypothetical protein [Clostridium beijerinckii]|uniref:hypothetical protein n=1 Tax=Clostridium beijerinckii TaxID=1520 RepID=UPI0012FE4488|nr:hypothetical protein [Clostridium beijerinckii]
MADDTQVELLGSLTHNWNICDYYLGSDILCCKMNDLNSITIGIMQAQMKKINLFFADARP